MPVWRGILNLCVAALRALPMPGLWAAAVVLWFGMRAVVGYSADLVPLTVAIDGVSQRVHTRCATVGEVLADAGVQVSAWDAVFPELETPVETGMTISVRHPRQVTILADGQTLSVHTFGLTAAEVLDQIGLDLDAADGVWVDGRPWTEQANVEPLVVSAAGSGVGGQVVRSSFGLSSRGRQSEGTPAISTIEIKRARRIRIHDHGLEQTVATLSSTVGEALAEAGTVLYLGDVVHPDPQTPVSPGLQVRIDRGVMVYVEVDGASLRARTRAGRVQDVLAEMGVVLSGKDYCEPDPRSPVVEGMRIRVVRVKERWSVQEAQIPFETQWIGDSALELDHRRVDQVGANGILRWRYRETYQNGLQVSRVLEDEWVAQEPSPRQIAYGTKIVVRTQDTPEGPIEYWRHVRVFLTSYTEATCGKTPDHPLYGITRLGWQMRHGIIAVDPRVIRMRSELYVPGYGRGIAGDTGGLIKGKHIDLGHEVDDFTMYYWWGEVYVLTPVPPSSQINYILPDYPRER